MESSTPFRSAKRGAVGEKLCDTRGEVVPEMLGRKDFVRVEPDGCARYRTDKCRKKGVFCGIQVVPRFGVLIFGTAIFYFLKIGFEKAECFYIKR